MSDPVTLEHNGAIATITFRNPGARNALEPWMQREAIDALREVRFDDEVRCVVLTGEGSSFCAGAAVNELEDYGLQDIEDDTENGFHEMVRLIMLMKKPVVAKVPGAAMGGGVNTAMACDFVYASEDAVFGWIFSHIGVTQDSGTSFILPRLVGMRTAAELVYTTDPIDATEALEHGLVNNVVPADELDDVVAEKAEELAAGPTVAFGETKRAMLRGSHVSIEDALEREALAQAKAFETDDKEEGVAAFLEGREPEFEGR